MQRFIFDLYLREAGLLPDCEKVMLCFLSFINRCINFELLCSDFDKGNRPPCIQRLALADRMHLYSWAIDWASSQGLPVSKG